MKTFIRAVEIWVPNKDRASLEFGGGLYRNAPGFRAASALLRLARGEGLPGQAWDRGLPVVMTPLDGISSFRRGAAAREAGLTSGIAIPIFAGDFLTSVLVLLCGDDDVHAGAIEVWRATPATSPDMTLLDAYYGTTADTFEFLSRHTRFRRGVGLPGMVWESGVPVFIEDLGKSDRFLRADTATRVGINRGLGIPCATGGDDVCVLTFLSALGTPVSRRFEVWMPGESRQYLHRVDGFCERAGRLLKAPPGMMIERGHGAIGRVCNTGAPALSERASAELGPYGAEIDHAGLSSLVALPLIAEGRLTAAVVWYW